MSAPETRPVIGSSQPRLFRTSEEDLMQMLNKNDRARIERLSQKIDEYHRLADATNDPVKRDRYFVLAKRAEKSRQMQQTFPGSIFLWGWAVVLTLIPWSLLGDRKKVV